MLWERNTLKRKGRYASSASRYRWTSKAGKSRKKVKAKAKPNRTYRKKAKTRSRKKTTFSNVSKYQKFIAKRVRGAKGSKVARRKFKSAVKEWKNMARKNAILPYMAFNPLYRSRRSGRFQSPRKRRAKSKKLRRIGGGGWKNNRRKKRGTRKGMRRKTARRAYRRNPLYRSRSTGRFQAPRRRRKTSKRLRRIGGGGWKNNALYRNRKGRFTRRKTGRKLRRRRSGGWKNNAILPYMAFNNPLDAVVQTGEKLLTVDLWTKTILPITGGWIGTEIVGYQLANLVGYGGSEYTGLVKHGARLGTAVLLSAATGFFVKDRDIAAKVLAGGLVAFVGGILMEAFGPDIASLKGETGAQMAGFGNQLSSKLKSAIKSGLEEKLRGGGHMGAFVTEQALNRAPRLGDFMTEQDLEDATVGTGLPGRAGGGPPRAGETPVHLDTFQNSAMDGLLV